MSAVRRPRRWAGVLAALAPFAAASAQPTAYSSDVVVAGEFRAACQRLTEGDNLYFGSGMLDALRAATDDRAAAIDQRVARHARLGWELFRLGELAAAASSLEAARALIDQLPEESRGDLPRRIALALGAVYLQLGEHENCHQDGSPNACILPFASDALHRRPEPARKAAAVFERFLERHGDDSGARWLLHLARAVTGTPTEAAQPAEADDGAPSSWTSERWRNLGRALGFDAADLAGGAVMDDFDGDGWLDLVTTSWHPCSPMRALRNDGRGGFIDVTERWGLASQLGGLNLVQTDYDGDGMLDLLVLRGAWLGDQGKVRNSLLRNDLRRPAARFVDVTSAAGLAYPAYPTQAAAWADYDLDGDLDLFVGNESSSSNAGPLELLGSSGDTYPSQLFRNNGDGTFTDVARTAGVRSHRFTKGVAWGDYDDDGDPDLYVSAFGPNRLYRNLGDGRFEDVAPALGLTAPEGSFATWFFDVDNDLDLDLYVSDYSTPFPLVAASLLGEPVASGHPVLYRNEGGAFVDASAAVGFDRPQLPMGANYGDLDNDGFLDLYLGTGLPEFEAVVPNVMYRNRGGERFDDVTAVGGFGHLQKGHGVAFGDLDRDGDQDLLHQLGGAYPYDVFANAVFENPSTGSSWLVLRLEGTTANRVAIGARVTVTVSAGGRTWKLHRQVGSGGSFGGSSLQLELGLGDAERIDAISVRWPGSEAAEAFTGADLDRAYRVVQGSGSLEPLDYSAVRLGGGSSGSG